MISISKFLADLFHRCLGNFPNNIDSHLTGHGNRSAAFVGADILRRYVIGSSHLFDDLFHGNWKGLVVVENFVNDVLCYAQIWFRAGEKAVYLHLFDGPFQLTDIAFEFGGDVVDDIVWNIDL